MENYQSFDFAHKDATQKRFTISYVSTGSGKFQGWSFERAKKEILTEVAKCRLLCHECHKNETATRQAL